MRKTSLLIVLLLVLSPGAAVAYIDPGVGAGTIAIVAGVGAGTIAIVAAVVLAFFGALAAVLWYPIKCLIKGRKAAKADAATPPG